MKRIGLLAVVLLASLSMAAGSFAADKMMEKEHAGKALKAPAAGEEIISANRFIGTDVENLQGKEIGEVQDLMIDRQTGQVGYVILSETGFAGIEEERYAVPFAAFREGADPEVLVLTVDEEKLADAPKRKAGMTDREYSRQLHDHYGQAPYWEATSAPGFYDEARPPERDVLEKK